MVMTLLIVASLGVADRTLVIPGWNIALFDVSGIRMVIALLAFAGPPPGQQPVITRAKALLSRRCA